MDMKLSGKRALVTGSTGGIGEEIAKTLAREGVAVVVHGRRDVEARRVVNEIEGAGGKAAAVLGDLSRKGDAEKVVANSLETFGGIDILVNNAGGYAMLPWMETAPEKWAAMFNEDVISSIRMIQGMLPSMKKLGWGRVVQISTVVAWAPFPLGPDYSAAKAALANMTVSLSKELAGTGVTANTVSPGPVVTPGFKKWLLETVTPMGWKGSWEEIEKRAAKEFMPNAVGRLGHVEDVAAAVTFLASPLSGFITGANYRVDGGMGGTVN
jgi:3-oxoacyl-[acyl-carrier protein] reductase